MSTPTVYVICGTNCKYEGMTREQIIAAITQAVETHEITDVDTGFVTTIKEQNCNAPFKVWLGTQAQYNAISMPSADTLYLITDDDTLDNITAAVEEIQERIVDIVTGVKGEAESEYRSGQVNITPENIGALKKYEAEGGFTSSFTITKNRYEEAVYCASFGLGSNSNNGSSLLYIKGTTTNDTYSATSHSPTGDACFRLKAHCTLTSGNTATYQIQIQQSLDNGLTWTTRTDGLGIRLARIV